MEFTLYERALLFAVIAHGDQRRKYTNAPYIVHPIRVAALVREQGATTAAIAAALLHDVLEDTFTTYGELVDGFGEYAARLVFQITDTSVTGDGTRKMRKEMFSQKLAVADVEAQLIKACDILDNVKTIAQHDPQFARVYLLEKKAQLEVLDKLPADMAQAVQGVLEEAARALIGVPEKVASA